MKKNPLKHFFVVVELSTLKFGRFTNMNLLGSITCTQVLSPAYCLVKSSLFNRNVCDQEFTCRRKMSKRRFHSYLRFKLVVWIRCAEQQKAAWFESALVFYRTALLTIVFVCEIFAEFSLTWLCLYNVCYAIAMVFQLTKICSKNFLTFLLSCKIVCLLNVLCMFKTSSFLIVLEMLVLANILLYRFANIMWMLLFNVLWMFWN